MNINPRKPSEGWLSRWAKQSLELSIASWSGFVSFILVIAISGFVSFALMRAMPGPSGTILTQGFASAIAGVAVMIALRDMARSDGHPAMSLREMMPRLREFAIMNFMMSTVFGVLSMTIPETSVASVNLDVSGSEDVSFLKMIIILGQMNLVPAMINAGVVGVSSMALAACMNQAGLMGQMILGMVTLQKMPVFYMSLLGFFMCAPMIVLMTLQTFLIPFVTWIVITVYYVAARDIYGHIDKNGIPERSQKRVFAT